MEQEGALLRHTETRTRIVEAHWDKRENFLDTLGQEGELLRHTGTRGRIVEAHWDNRENC
jgi:hypothetical protein